MKQQYIIFGILILILTFSLFYVFANKQKQGKQTSVQSTENNSKRKKVEIKTTDLDKTKDLNELVYGLIEHYYPDYNDSSFENLDIVSQTFVLIIDADGQINNGGIIQFIDNGTGNRFHETIEAARRIDCKILIEILTRASRQFPNGQIPKDWDERRKVYDELCEKHISYITFDELSSEEQQIVLETRKKFRDTRPLDECSFEQKNNWSDKWEELDNLYYENSNIIYQTLVDYLRNNAKLVD